MAVKAGSAYVELGARVDRTQFEAYDRHLKSVREQVARKQHFKAQLGADFNPRAFNAFEREVKQMRLQGEKGVTLHTHADLTGLARYKAALHGVGAEVPLANSKLGRLAGSFKSLGGAATVAAGAFVAMFAVFEIGKHSIKTTEELAKSTARLQAITGADAETASSWVQIAKTRNVEGDKLNKVFLTLSRQMSSATKQSKDHGDALASLQAKQMMETDAAKKTAAAMKDKTKAHEYLTIVEKKQGLATEALVGKTGASIDAFRKLGITQKELSTLGTEKVMLKVSDGLKGMSSASDRAALAQKLFGKGAAQLLPFFLQGSAAITKQKDSMKAYGATLDQEGVDRAKKAAAAQREMKVAMQGVQITIGEFLAPALTKVTIGLSKFLRQMRDGTGTGGKFVDIMKTVGHGFANIVGGVKDTIQIFRRVDSAILAFGSSALKVLEAVFKGLSHIPGLGGKFRGLADDMKHARESIDKTKESLDFKVAARDAEKAIEHLAEKGKGNFVDMRKVIAKNTGFIRDHMGSDTAAGKTALQANFKAAERAIGRSMKAGLISTRDGLAEIRSLMTHELEVFGVKGVLKSEGTKSLSTKFDGTISAPKPTKARGGWIGNRGDVGFDDVPIGGNAIAARGEFYAAGPTSDAILSRHQQPYADMALAAGGYGGLSGLASMGAGVDQVGILNSVLGGGGGLAGLFGAVQRPHYLASGGYASGGGNYNKAQLEALWIKAGGPSSAAPLMAAIALAESRGDPNIVNSIGATGLWQIHPGGSQYLDPMTNARTAVMKFKTQGLQAWEAYTNGSYRQFTGGSAGSSSLAGMGGSAAVSQVMKKIKAPRTTSTGLLGSIVQGGLDRVAAAATTFGQSQLDASGGGGGGGGGGASRGPNGVGSFMGVPMANWVIEALQYAQSKGVSVAPTSGYRPGFDSHTASGTSEHQGRQYPHGAVDFGGYNSGLGMKMSVVNATRDFKYPLLAPQGFHDDGHASGTGHAKGGFTPATLMRKMWGAAARYYGGSMPPTSLGVKGKNLGKGDRSALGLFALTLGKGTTAGGQGRRHVYIPSFLTGVSEPFAETLLHEWAHAYQSPEVFGGPADLAEGGAQAFTRAIAPGVFSAMGSKFKLSRPGQDSYYKMAQKALKAKGMDWVMHGQFAKNSGTQHFESGGDTKGDVGTQASWGPFARFALAHRLTRDPGRFSNQVGSGRSPSEERTAEYDFFDDFSKMMGSYFHTKRGKDHRPLIQFPVNHWTTGKWPKWFRNLRHTWVRRYLGVNARHLRETIPYEAGGMQYFGGGGNRPHVTSQHAQKSSGGGQHKKPASEGTGIGFAVLGQKQATRVASYTSLEHELTGLQRDYQAQDRRYNLTDEVLVDPDTGEVNQDGIEKRAGEIEALIAIAMKIARKVEHMRDKALQIVKAYKTMIARLQFSYAWSRKGKDRAGIKTQLDNAQTEMGTWQDTAEAAGYDVTDRWLDVDELRKEEDGVRGTAGNPSTPDSATADSASGSGSDGPTADQQAIQDQLSARLALSEKNAAGNASALAAFASSGDIGAGGRNALSAASNGVLGGGGVAGGAVGGGAAPGNVATVGAGLNITIQSLVPPTGAQAQVLADAVVSAISQQPFVSASTQNMGI